MSDAFPESLFELIYNRAPSDADRKRLLGTKAVLRLSDDDEIWPVLLTLDHYTGKIASGRRDILQAVDGMHDRVAAAVGRVEQSVEIRADRVVTQVVEEGIDRLLGIVQQTQDVADRITRKQYITAASLTGIVALLCITVGFALGYIVLNRMMTHQLDTCASESFPTSENRKWCYVN
jgi:hypothetical protein